MAEGSRHHDAPTLLADLIERTPSCVLTPLAFFVSWQGVITIAYTGFPAALLDLKARVAAAHPSLPPEAPGSKWPKTSVACLREGRRLTPGQLGALLRCCREVSSNLYAGWTREWLPRITVDCASVAVYSCRCLERLVSCHTVALAGGTDTLPPSEEEQARVQALVAESDSEDYWFKASRDGNREGHYRGDHVGATLVCGLADGGPAAGLAGVPGRPRGAEEAAARAALLAAVAALQRRVEAELPGLYAWFEPSSLHVTLRALV